jgi:hypothetical protein
VVNAAISRWVAGDQYCSKKREHPKVQTTYARENTACPEKY